MRSLAVVTGSRAQWLRELLEDSELRIDLLVDASGGISRSHARRRGRMLLDRSLRGPAAEELRMLASETVDHARELLGRTPRSAAVLGLHEALLDYAVAASRWLVLNKRRASRVGSFVMSLPLLRGSSSADGERHRSGQMLSIRRCSDVANPCTVRPRSALIHRQTLFDFCQRGRARRSWNSENR